MNLLSSKKGQIRNYFLVITFLFSIGFTAILAYKILSEIVTAYASTGHWSPIMASTADKFLFSIAILDYIIVIQMAVFLVGLALTSYRLRTSPAFFIVSIIMSLFLGFVGYLFNYLFKELVSQPTFTATLLYFPRTVLILSNLHWIGLAAFVVGSIALYAKKPEGEDTSGIVRQ